MEIAPNIHKIEDLTGCNVVLLTGGDQMAVVDTGMPGNGERIVDYVRSIGRSPSDLRWIVLTHHHHDHSGSAAELHALTGAQIAAHVAETEAEPDGTMLLRKGTEAQHIPFWYRWIIGAARRPATQRAHFPDTPVHHRVHDGDKLPGLDHVGVLHTPGHTPGSICLLVEGTQMLFLGDSAINNRDRISRPLMWDRQHRRELDASLRRLRELDAEIASFGHGPHLDREVMERLRALTDRPYDLPTWRIVLKNWRTLRRFHQSTRRPGHWDGSARPAGGA